jgi:hypothetical protein
MVSSEIFTLTSSVTTTFKSLLWMVNPSFFSIVTGLGFQRYKFCTNVRNIYQESEFTAVADPSMMPKMQVDYGAIKFVLRGSNIMCPGLTSTGGKMEDVQAGTVVVGYIFVQ